MLLYEPVQDFDSVFSEQRGRVHVQVWHAVFKAASGRIKGNNYEIPVGFIVGLLVLPVAGFFDSRWDWRPSQPGMASCHLKHGRRAPLFTRV